jgi:hypothetical protein
LVLLKKRTFLYFETRAVSMTDEEYREQIHKRWQESMSLLGFEDSGPKPEPAETEQPTAAEPPATELLPSQSVISEIMPMAESSEAPSKDHEAQSVLASNDKWSEPERLETVIAAADSETALMSADKKKPLPVQERSEAEGGRHRRGRRGRRGKRADSEEAKRADDGTESASAEQESQQRDRGGRRGRPRQRTSRPAEAANVEEETTPSTTESNEFGEDESTDPSEWNVPSWQELIASLYRPER